jgi:3-hydroxyisobutyrate dehydrogenase-like beta-hydroxyacid dehydrogenase
MHLIIGLGPIGGNIGARLAETRRDVYGYDFDTERLRSWSAENNSPAGSDLAEIDWQTVESVHVAVRLGDQVASVFEAIKDSTAHQLTVFVHTTLAPGDARRIVASAPANWRVFEAPVSGGAQGARRGSMTIFLGGPATTEGEDRLLASISGRVFLNNTLATYNLASTARMLILAEQLGMPAQKLFEVIGVSTGQSWVSDNFVDVPFDLLLKDVGLLRGEIGPLPAGSLSEGVAQEILDARTLLGP